VLEGIQQGVMTIYNKIVISSDFSGEKPFSRQLSVTQA